MINGRHQFTLVQQQASSRKPINSAFHSLSFKGKRGYQEPYNFTTKLEKQQIDINDIRDFKALLEGKRPSKMQQKEQKERSKVYGAIIKCSNANRTSYALVQGRYTGKWSFPKGHSDGDESPYQCALREVNEETGLTSLSLSNPTDCLKIGFGNYYLFEVETEYELKPRDTNEIMETRWVTLEEMKCMTLNVDASYYRKQLEANLDESSSQRLALLSRWRTPTGRSSTRSWIVWACASCVTPTPSRGSLASTPRVASVVMSATSKPVRSW